MINGLYQKSCLLVGCVLASIVLCFFKVPYELIGLFSSPLITLLIYQISEEQKILWNAKYQTFLFLMSMRHSNIDFEVMRHLNSIDIIFINDKKVRECWNTYFDVLQNLARYSADEFETRKIDLLNAMSKSLGLNNNIKYSDIKRFYYPQGLVDIDEFHNEKNTKELEYYNCIINHLTERGQNETTRTSTKLGK